MKINKSKKEHLMTNQNYRNYNKKKEKLINKYPSNLFAKPSSGPKPEDYPQEQRDNWKNWCKDILDLMFEPDGDFQKFTWDILSEQEKLSRERKSRGRKINNYD